MNIDHDRWKRHGSIAILQDVLISAMTAGRGMVRSRISSTYLKSPSRLSKSGEGDLTYQAMCGPTAIDLPPLVDCKIGERHSSTPRGTQRKASGGPPKCETNPVSEGYTCRCVMVIYVFNSPAPAGCSRDQVDSSSCDFVS